MKSAWFYYTVTAIGLFLAGIVLPLQAENVDEPKIEEERSIKWTFSFHGGLSGRVGSLPQDVNGEFYNLLSSSRRGIFGKVSIGCDFSRHFLPLGLTAQSFYSSNKQNEYQLSTSIIFIGPFFRVLEKDLGRHKSVLEFGPGCILYRTGGMLPIEKMISGTALGVNASYCYEYQISDIMAISCSFTGTNGVLKKATLIEDGVTEQLEWDQEDCESLTHWGVSVGLRFGF